MIDLRSDTVTKPTLAMRRAMMDADVGDDVYQEDPTVNRLERRAAEIFGKQAALFVPTGTMGNTIAIKLLTEPGEEVICESRSHLFNYELGMPVWFANCQLRPVEAPDGILTWDLIEKAYRPPGPHWAPTGCVEIENTHNIAGGSVYPRETIEDIAGRAHERGLRVHMDGARIFNAAAATGCSVRDLAGSVDTVMFCLSKGLGAPVGSMLVGTAESMDRARLYRKRLGGGMRQAGVLAAAGLIALEESPLHLHEDHAKARSLAAGLASLPGIRVDPARIATNIVVFDVSGAGIPASQISHELRQRSVLINPINSTAMRAVTHYDVSAADCEKAVAALAETLSVCHSN